VNILFLSHQYPPETGYGGIGSYVSTMSQTLAERGHEVHVLSCWGQQPKVDKVEDQVVVHRRPHIRVRGAHRLVNLPGMSAVVGAVRLPADQPSANPLWRLATSLTCLLEYRRLGLPFDVIEAPDWMAEGLLVSLRSKVPMVVDLKGNLHTYSRASGLDLGWQGRLSDAMERCEVSRAAAVTSPSLMTAELLGAAGWPNVTKATIVRRPVDLKRWRPAPSSAGGKPLILQIGRLETIKAPDVLVRAAARLRAAIPDLEVVFIGGSNGSIEGRPAAERVRELAAQLGVRCMFVGHTPWAQIARWFEQARVVTVASRFDNFPNVGLEALACGRPVVCSDRTGLAELAESGNRSIAVVEAGNPDTLADGLAPYLCDRNLATKAGLAGRELVKRHCAPKVIAAQREEVYERVATL
jgi:glycosyltransferase involved in cell wall biosynthesis